MMSSSVDSSTAHHPDETDDCIATISGWGPAHTRRCCVARCLHRCLRGPSSFCLHPHSPQLRSPPSPFSQPKHVFVILLLQVFPFHPLTAATAFRLGVAPLDVLPRRSQRLPPSSCPCPPHIIAVVIAVLPPTRRRNEDAGSSPAGTAATNIST